jgi:uncharacterized membrane protein YebE (DUF533 family)
MDESVLFNGVLRSVLGGRRRPGRRAMGFLTGMGGSLLSNPAALLTAAGVAWGIFETMKDGSTGGMQGTPAGATSGVGLNTGTSHPSGSAPAASAPVTPFPPQPVAGPAVATPMTDATRMVRLALSAAQADGALGDAERATVLARAQEAGLAELVERELQQPRPLVEIVAGVSDPAQRATLYSLAFAVARADEQVGGAERIYLAQLANLLGLAPATVQQLEAAASAKIDATPEA